jgi:hypothetical protein
MGHPVSLLLAKHNKPIFSRGELDSSSCVVITAASVLQHVASLELHNIGRINGIKGK